MDTMQFAQQTMISFYVSNIFRGILLNCYLAVIKNVYLFVTFKK